MFSDSQTPGEHRGFKPHAPHFIPWLRNSLKSHHSSDLGLNGPYKSNSEGRNNLTPLEKPKGIGLFSIQGKERPDKADLRCNGVGMARMLPVMLRGPHFLTGSLGKRREDSPVRWNQSPELEPDANTHSSQGDGRQGPVSGSSSAQDNPTFVRNHSSHLSLPQPQNDRTNASAKKYGPLVGPPPAQESNCKAPVVVCTEDRKGKVWDYAGQTTNRQRDLHSCSLLSPDAQGLTGRQHGYSSSSCDSKPQSRSQRDLTALREPAVDGFNSKVIFSTEVPQRDPGGTTTLRGPRKPRPSSACMAVLDQNQTWVRHRSTGEGEAKRKEGGCSRKAVRNQIKRVVTNLEQVLTALRDVHQEMREVVQQIDHLTSAIDLNEEEQHGTGGGNGASDSSSSSGSSSSDQGPSEPEVQHSRSWSPPGVQLCLRSTQASSERTQTLRLPCSLGSPPKQTGLRLHSSPALCSPPQLPNLTSDELSLPPQRSLPVRPPTPGLSPLTVNLHPPNSPASQPHSPAPSSPVRIRPVSPPSPLTSKPHPPPTLSPSVTIETKVGSYQTPQSDHPSAGSSSPSGTQPPSASCPPTASESQSTSSADGERAASSERPGQAASQASVARARPPVTQTRRRGKPPPYPHHRLSEHTKKSKEPRKAPPYPEKRRLLSTTV
ncbi:serine/arginine repetitive matrix protein 1 [Echeneis naucrates]|uniref:serine/arginine repetitive matrix protein 1 n=1 Tax=Echeneis naucrates TaxID=173247 RepID=UPI001113A348|nr:serine/arginine repetitive matrix protein 1-like [Echeneis naucrates]